MVKCEVYVDGTSDKYEGQYEVIDNVLMVEIFNYNGMGWNTMKFSSDVTYKEIMILDFSNKRYMYSSLFYNCGLLYGLVQSEKYKTDYFFETSNHESIHSYETYVTNNEGTIFKLIHSHLSEEKRIKRPNHKPIKIDFEKYLEDVYKKINFRNTNSRNEFILLDFKRPTSLEDQYIFYFRYIDMYMGKRLMLEGKNTSNYARLSSFIDEYIEYFKKDKDYSDINNFKNELNSLRNHFVHEGYYFSDNQFSVTRNREHLYYQMIDYQWLYDIVKIFKLCSYLMLYKNILSIEIDDEELKMALL